MSDLDSIVDRLVEAQYSKESPVQIANMHDRIAELQAEVEGLQQKLKEAESEKAVGWSQLKILEARIAKAKTLVEHRSLYFEDCRRELLEILEGVDAE